MSAKQTASKLITTQFSRKIWNPVRKAIKEYQLVEPGDRIAVCISGGKDSMLMAKCFQELKLHNKFDAGLYHAAAAKNL